MAYNPGCVLSRVRVGETEPTPANDIMSTCEAKWHTKTPQCLLIHQNASPATWKVSTFGVVGNWKGSDVPLFKNSSDKLRNQENSRRNDSCQASRGKHNKCVLSCFATLIKTNNSFKFCSLRGPVGPYAVIHPSQPRGDSRLTGSILETPHGLLREP